MSENEKSQQNKKHQQKCTDDSTKCVIENLVTALEKTCFIALSYLNRKIKLFGQICFLFINPAMLKSLRNKFFICFK